MIKWNGFRQFEGRVELVRTLSMFVVALGGASGAWAQNVCAGGASSAS